MSGAEELLREVAGPCIVVVFFCVAVVARIASCLLAGKHAPNLKLGRLTKVKPTRIPSVQLEQDWPSVLVHFRNTSHDSR